MKKVFDSIVIGGGHAGIEAGMALAKLGNDTLIMSLSLNNIGFMACNPNIGGTAKGHLVKEIDALGGVMGVIADKCTIQTRMLNLGNGAAVHSLRNQVDKEKYSKIMKHTLELQENLTLIEGEITDILVENGKVYGVKTALGDTYKCKAVVLATGVYLDSRIIIGDYIEECGPSGYKKASYLTKSLLNLGLPIRKFKTGTPARVLKNSCDFSVMKPQYGDSGLYTFSEETDYEVQNDRLCYLTYTNPTTHKIILDNLDRSPMYNGSISGTGPRYCPSIETKVVRFADKERHQIFVEPEGDDNEEMYVQGLSTSMPYDIQEQMIHSIVGLENAKIMRYGYAIEYDCIDPFALLPTLEVKNYKGLFSAGQINGSSGYEEAGAQGLIAGINASRYINNQTPLTLGRDKAYIGVLIDDLVTKGTEEPYRMMTSRAEHRLYLRQDNADIRLTPIGYEIGLITKKRYDEFLAKMQQKEDIKKSLKKRYSAKEIESVFLAKNEDTPTNGISGYDLLKRTTMNYTDLIKIDSDYKKENVFILRQIDTEIKYEGYLKKQEQSIKEMQKMEKHSIPSDINYEKIQSLRLEAREKLEKIRPINLAQASRISGVNPADIVVLMVYLQKKGD